MKRWGILALIVVALVVVIGGIKGYSVYKMIQGFKAQGIPKQSVSTTKAVYSQWQPQLQAIGSLRALRGADLSAEVSGVVEDVVFQSGASAKAGQMLVKLRAADDLAKLDALKASAELAKANHLRDLEQYKANAISKAALDASDATLKSAVAQVAEQQALVNKKLIRAPFAGQLGIRAVDPGQYVAPGTKLVTLQQLDPIYADFTLPQQALAQLKVGQRVQASSDAYTGQAFNGEIAAIDAKVDPDTRNVQLRALLKNPEHKLLPGMFASLKVDTGTPQRYLTLPQAAITFNPYGETVFVLLTAAQLKAERAKNNGAAQGDAKSTTGEPEPEGEQLVAKQVFVTVGATRGDQIAVLSGLKEGDVVVTSGQIKLKTGSAVEVNNTVLPLNNPDPKVRDE
ncbi:membrane fusion protein, multidrug efflux system [Solimonas aquatica]|uniref:Membrane fusion protein, multidrug efflux system n=1 Tax=Solimonas aquatica TaxID=489703 RepID=A0A1H9GVC4_9GAMM|nr:efflux RND transporter periplasmic adaptor subunit [Solimonas aquatica]SEQ54041.1 membrane fusion protein, multidrug efflux system [Solimonas aquatica]